MRKVLAVIGVFLLVAIILLPVSGFTFMLGPRHPYSIGSTKLNYTFHAGIPASEMTPKSIQPSAAPTPAVKVTRVRYSFKVGIAPPYSAKANSKTIVHRMDQTSPKASVAPMSPIAPTAPKAPAAPIATVDVEDLRKVQASPTTEANGTKIASGTTPVGGWRSVTTMTVKQALDRAN